MINRATPEVGPDPSTHRTSRTIRGYRVAQTQAENDRLGNRV